MKLYIEVLKKYAVFTGRASRSEYWTFVLLTWMIVIATVEIIDILSGSYELILIMKLYLLALMVPYIAVSVRRLHDIGRSGWFFLVNLMSISPSILHYDILPGSIYNVDLLFEVFLPIGIITTIIWFIFMTQDSDPGNNQYGKNPKGKLETSKYNNIILIMAAVLILWVWGVFSHDRNPPRFITVPGTETIGMKDTFHGSILMTYPVGGLAQYTLPSMKEEFIRIPVQNRQRFIEKPSAYLRDIETERKGIVRSVSGPDSLGRIVYIENHMRAKKHKLKVKNLTNGVEDIIFTRPGDALWGRAIGDELSLSPVGGLVAVLFNGDYHKEGDITIWDIKSHQQLPFKIRGVDRGFAWFPDAKKFLYVKLLPIETVLDLIYSGLITMTGIELDKELKDVNYPIPVIYQLDLNTGLSMPLSIGMTPQVSKDGKYIISKSLDRSWTYYDISLNIFQKTFKRGMANRGPIALLDSSHALYWSYPTDEGTVPKMTTHNSPLVGKKQMLTIKIVNMKTGEFETLLPYVDPRTKISYGASK